MTFPNEETQGVTTHQTALIISVLTRGRTRYLEDCLASVALLDIPAGLALNLHIIDNNAVARGPDFWQEVLPSLPFRVRIFHEPNQGIVHARNRALREAQSAGAELMAFVDDDEVVSRHWLSRFVAVMRHTKASIVTGPVASVFSAETTDWVRRLSLFQPRKESPRRGIINSPAYTNNVLFQLSMCANDQLVFDRNFNDTGGSDVVFFARAHLLGYTTAWVEEVLVLEQIPESRTSLGWILRRRFRHGNQRWRTGKALEKSSVFMGCLIIKAIARLIVCFFGVWIAPVFGTHKIVDVLGVGADGLGTLYACAGARLPDYQTIHGR